MQPVVQLFAWIRTDAGPDETALLEPSLGAVGIEAWDDVEGARVERARDDVVVPVAREQPVDEVERGGASRPLHRVDVGLDEERRLVRVLRRSRCS